MWVDHRHWRDLQEGVLSGLVFQEHKSHCSYHIPPPPQKNQKAYTLTLPTIAQMPQFPSVPEVGTLVTPRKHPYRSSSSGQSPHFGATRRQMSWTVKHNSRGRNPSPLPNERQRTKVSAGKTEHDVGFLFFRIQRCPNSGSWEAEEPRQGQGHQLFVKLVWHLFFGLWKWLHAI